MQIGNRIPDFHKNGLLGLRKKTPCKCVACRV